jgi:hypothetical protein
VQVFEVPTQVLRLHMSEPKLYKLADSVYSLSIVTPHELNAMLTSKAAPPRLLADNTRVVNDWPAKTDSWVYSPGYAGWGPDYISTGGAVGSLGVRESGGQLELRLDYLVNHSGPRGQRLIDSKIFYEYRYPEGRVLLFHAPTSAAHEISRLHVVAVEVTREHPINFLATPGSGRQPADILAYR